jgi:O-antigen/teichoic acid export membrane protein
MTNEDLTGRSRLVRNIGTSYASHFVFIFFGFVMPRMIDGHIGQEALGVWDFGWSFVNYMNLAMMGIGSSVNRYVARYRAAGDLTALNRTVCSVIAVQAAIATMVLLASLVLAWWMPVLFGERLGEHLQTAAWVILCLGGALSVQMAFDAWRGVLSGCHRWDYYNAINAGGHALSSLLMVAALVAGGGLRALAGVYLVTTVLTEIYRYFTARRICPELELRVSYCNKADAFKMIRFGAKTILLGLPSIVTTQTVSLFVMAHLGPAALAVLARPLALMRHISTLTSKYGYVLTPTAGSLQSQQKKSELHDFALQSARIGWLIALPPIILMFVLGDLIVDAWMGQHYAHWSLCAVLSAGSLLPIAQHGLLRVMVGLDVHGRIAKHGMVVASVLLVGGLILLGIFGWSLTRAAMLIALPAGLGLGIATLVDGVRYLNIGMREYARHALLPAVRLGLSIGVTLAALRFLSPYSSLVTVLIGTALTGAVTLVLQRRDVARVLVAVRA